MWTKTRLGNERKMFSYQYVMYCRFKLNICLSQFSTSIFCLLTFFPQSVFSWGLYKKSEKLLQEKKNIPDFFQLTRECFGELWDSSPADLLNGHLYRAERYGDSSVKKDKILYKLESHEDLKWLNSSAPDSNARVPGLNPQLTANS